MAISGIDSQVSSLQAVRAQSAFQKAVKPGKEDQKQEEIILPSPSKFSEGEKRYMSEIKSFAQQNSITDVDDEDIQYALRYGTSLLADYSA